MDSIFNWHETKIVKNWTDFQKCTKNWSRSFDMRCLLIELLRCGNFQSFDFHENKKRCEKSDRKTNEICLMVNIILFPEKSENEDAQWINENVHFVVFDYCISNGELAVSINSMTRHKSDSRKYDIRALQMHSTKLSCF